MQSILFSFIALLVVAKACPEGVDLEKAVGSLIAAGKACAKQKDFAMTVPRFLPTMR
jgi:hypothetical protein